MHKGEETRKQLALTAYKMFREQGYEKIAVRDICKECHVTTGSFYHHFASKEEVLLAWFRMYEAEQAKSLLPDLAAENDILEKLHRLVRFYIDLGCAPGKDLHRRIILSTGLLSLINGSQIQSSDSMFFRLFISVIEAGQKSGLFDERRSSDFLLLLADSVMIRNLFAWSETEQDFDVTETVLDQIDYILLKNAPTV